jgi:hypothetical protein
VDQEVGSLRVNHFTIQFAFEFGVVVVSVNSRIPPFHHRNLRTNGDACIIPDTDIIPSYDGGII